MSNQNRSKESQNNIVGQKLNNKKAKNTYNLPTFLHLTSLLSAVQFSKL